MDYKNKNTLLILPKQVAMYLPAYNTYFMILCTNIKLNLFFGSALDALVCSLPCWCDLTVVYSDNDNCLQ